MKPRLRRLVAALGGAAVWTYAMPYEVRMNARTAIDD